MPNAPRHPSGELRTEYLQIRLTPAARSVLELAAEHSPASLSAYLRCAGLEAAIRDLRAVGMDAEAQEADTLLRQETHGDAQADRSR